MVWNIWLVLLSIVFAVMKVRCQIYDNTPPILWIERDWIIRENDTVGSKIAQAHGEDSDGDQLVYSLEPTPFFGSNKSMPFRIDSRTGTVYLNESVSGRAGENLHLFTLADDGQLSAKNEINVNIIGATEHFNPSQPNTNFLKRGLFLHSPPRPPPPPPNFNGNPVFNHPPPYQSPNFPPGPHTGIRTVPFEKKERPPTTQLRPVKLPIPILEEHTTETASTTEAVSKKVSDIVDNSLEPSHQMLPIDQYVKSPYEIPSTIIPIISVCAVFLTISIVAVIFRKKILVGKPKDSKEDMRKQSSGTIVLQEDIGLNMLDWGGPRAFSNRYEPWQSGLAHPYVGNQISAPMKNLDRWEFPRHRLKFFNILGEGAFGQVWKCEALDLDGKDSGLAVVAVKTLKENATEKERSDLISELQVMKTLEPHPNVVRLLGCCTDKEPIFLIMEYISKGKLQSYLRNSRAERYYNNMHGHSKTLTSRDLTSFVYQVAKGMEFLSSNGIIHRDLAARNVLINEDHTCKVADFGFARDVTATHVYERKSEGRLPIRWMATESLYDNIFSIKSDVWSFGILIWEVVTLGSTPYPGMSAADVMKKVRDGYRLEKPEHCRRELYNIMYYCWDKDPKERPSFTECVELLEKLLLTETDYIELERFPDHSYYNMMSLSGEKL